MGANQPIAVTANRSTRWVVNVRLLAMTLACVLLLSLVAYFWHARQLERNATLFLSRAAEAESASNYAKAAENLFAYLKFRPAEVTARIRLAKNFSLSAKSSAEKARAVQLLAVAIGLAPDQTDLRCDHLTLLLESGDYSTALARAKELLDEQLLKEQPESLVALRVLALGLLASWRQNSSESISAVVDALERANRADPANVTLATELARLYRTQLREPDEKVREQLADAVMDRLVTSSSRTAEAHLGRYAYRIDFGLPGADDDLAIAAAVDVQKVNPTVQLAVGLRALQTEDWDTAALTFERMISLDPRSPRGYLGLARAARAQGKDQIALDTLTNGLRHVGTDNLELNLQLAAVQIKLGHQSKARATLDELESNIMRIPGREQNEFLGRFYLLQVQARLATSDFRGAISWLKQVLRHARAEPDSKQQVALKARVFSELAHCYLGLQQWDQAALAYQAAAELEPQSALARLDAARAWEAAGRLDEAVRTLADALALEDAPASAWVDYCSALFRQQIALSSGNRNWRPLELALRKAQQKAPDAVALKLLEAEYEAEQGHSELAAQMLGQLEEGVLASQELAGRLVLDYERLGKPADADRLLERLRSHPRSGSSFATVLAAVNLFEERKQYDMAEKMLASKTSSFSDEEQRNAQLKSIGLLLAQGQSDRAKWALLELAKVASADLRPVQLLLELATEAGDLKGIEHWERRLKDLEGPDGTHWRYYRGEKLIREAGEGEQSLSINKYLEEARVLQEEIERLRPAWAPGYLLKAKLHQVPSIRDDNVAIDAYEQALRLGERRPRIVEELVLALYHQNRLVEAGNYLKKLRDGGNLSPELASLAMMIDAREGNLNPAIETARREVARAPSRAEAHLQLGQLLAMSLNSSKAEQHSAIVEAESELKRAAELAPSETAAWSALLALYTGTGRTQDARALLDALKHESHFSEPVQLLLFAQMHELLGDVEDADAYYRKVVAEAPNLASSQIAAARFFFRRNPDQAEKCLRRAIALEPNGDVARRLLATLLVDRGGNDKEIDQAWKLLGKQQGGQPHDAIDRRVEALLLLRRGGTEYRQQARRALESLTLEGQPATPIDRLVLAEVYEREGKMGAAREQLQALVNRENPDPVHLAAYADHLLRAGRGHEASEPLRQLAAILPATRSSLTLGLHVRWLKDQKQESQIPQVLESYLTHSLASATSDLERARLLILVADLCSSVDLPKAAENCYRRALKFDAVAYSHLAQWLGGQKRIKEAIETCLKAAEVDETARPAIALSTVLSTSDASDEERGLAESLFQRALLMHGNQAELLLSLGTLRLLEGKNDEAIRLLQRTLERDARNLDAMNNLAMALSHDPSTYDEAIACLDRALEIAGSSPQLLDSKGWIRLKQHLPAEAEALFLEALELPPGDPRHRFHLALAYHSQGRMSDAREAIERAHRDNLPVGLLGPEERTELVRLEGALQ